MTGPDTRAGSGFSPNKNMRISAAEAPPPSPSSYPPFPSWKLLILFNVYPPPAPPLIATLLAGALCAAPPLDGSRT